MMHDRITFREGGRSYTVTGNNVGRALACFTALSALRTFCGMIAMFGGAEGISFVARKLFF